MAANRLLLPSIALLLAAPVAHAQLITIKTLPIAEGDQFRLFPSANVGMGGVSIALPDSLLDPFIDPARSARSLRGSARARILGSPTFYSLSENAGGGQTLPIAALGRLGAYYGGLGVAFQEVDRIDNGGFDTPLPIDIFEPGFRPAEVGTRPPSRQNRYAFGMLARELAGRGITLGVSALWSGLNHIDGTELLYAGSQGVRQRGDAIDLRIGLLKEWANGQSLEAMVLHNRFDMTHDVTWVDRAWDPNRRAIVLRARMEQNIDATNAWGLHLNYVRPLADSGWRIGAIATTNLMSHPHLPEYQIARVSVIPWDPGNSAAYDLGLGVAKARGPMRFGIDAIYEPIYSHTWGEARAPIATERGVLIPAGGKTTENWFRFNNAIVRAGVGHDLILDTTATRLHLQLGVGIKSINYALRQYDHPSDRTRRQRESWTEWQKSWGLTLHLRELELRYVGLRHTGTGRPGILPDSRAFPSVDNLTSGGGRNILSAPNGPLTLTDVATTTHQFAVSMPLR